MMPTFREDSWLYVAKAVADMKKLYETGSPGNKPLDIATPIHSAQWGEFTGGKVNLKVDAWLPEITYDFIMKNSAKKKKELETFYGIEFINNKGYVGRQVRIDFARCDIPVAWQEDGLLVLDSSTQTVEDSPTPTPNKLTIEATPNNSSESRQTSTEWTTDGPVYRYGNEIFSKITELIDSLVVDKTRYIPESREKLKVFVENKLRESLETESSKCMFENCEVNEAIVAAIRSIIGEFGAHERGTKAKEFQLFLDSLFGGAVPSREENKVSSNKLAAALGVDAHLINRTRKVRKELLSGLNEADEPYELIDPANEPIDGMVTNSDQSIPHPMIVAFRDESEIPLRTEDGVAREDDDYESDWDNERNCAEIVDSDSENDGEEYFPNSEDDTDSEQEFADKELKKRRRKEAICKFIYARVRKQWKRKIDKSFIRFWCHLTFRMDTFYTRRVLVDDISNEGGSAEYHDVRILDRTLKEAFADFTESATYKSFQVANATKNKDGIMELATISMELFRRAFCPCCRQETQRDCSNEKKRGHQEYIKALQKMIKKLDITISDVCETHEFYKINFSSQSAFFESITCGSKPFPEFNLKSRENFKRQDEIEKENIDHFERVKQESKKRRPVSVPPSTKRAKVVNQKTEIKIANVTAGDTFKVIKRECLAGECKDCGVKKFFPETLPAEFSSLPNTSVKVPVLEFKKVARDHSDAQMEFKMGAVTASEGYEKLKTSTEAYGVPYFDDKWESQQRKYFYQTFNEDWIAVMGDFSAILDVHPQDNLNSHQDLHVMQFVLNVSYSPRVVMRKDGTMHRVFKNDAWHFWAADKDFVTSNSQFVFMCLDKINNHYRELLGESYINMAIFSDGCAEQFKCRLGAFRLGGCCFRWGLYRAVWNFAPTSCFKVVIDSLGGHTKAFVAKYEKSQRSRCTHAKEVFETCLKMDKLNRDVETENIHTEFGLDNRYQVYVCDSSEVTEDADLVNKNIIHTEFKEHQVNCTVLNGIRSHYRIECRGIEGEYPRSSQVPYSQKHTSEDKVIYIKKQSCWCRSCLYDINSRCLYEEITGKYEKVTLRWRTPVAPKRVQNKVVEEANAATGVPVPSVGVCAMKVGDAVEGKVGSNWFPGNITAINTKIVKKKVVLSYNIDYLDSTSKDKVKVDCVRPFVDYNVDEFVIGHFLGDRTNPAKWYPARILEKDMEENYYHIIYNDNDAGKKYGHEIVERYRLGRSNNPAELIFV